MAQLRERPYGNANFLVDFGNGQADTLVGGFSEVIFPWFEAVPAAGMAPAGADTEADSANRLVLKRGFMGSLDLYAWWHRAREGRAPKRKTLQVKLLSEDHESVVATWRFSGVRPVSLAYSPLQANGGGLLIETVEFVFERMEMF